MNTIDILFEVKKIIFRNIKNGYSILNIKLKEHPENVKIPTAEHIATGFFPAIHIKDEFKATGMWVDTGVNGYKFKIKTFNLIFPETNKGMIDFLVRFINGVGKVIATRIVKEFNENTFNVITNNPEKLLNIKGITKKKAKAINRAIVKHKNYENIAIFLISLGLNHSEVVFVYDKLGYKVTNSIKENPYILCNYSVSFYKADRIAKKFGFKSNNIERIKQGILLFMNIQMKNRGDLFVYEDYLIKELPMFLDKIGYFKRKDNLYYNIEEKDIKIAMGDLIVLKTLDTEKDKENRNCIYFSIYKYIENQIVEKILNIKNSTILNSISEESISVYIRKHELKTGIILAPKQKDAIYMALNNKLSILSGGPGTGKTQTINATISCIKEDNPEAIIKLCAPTGKAAKRMTQLTNMEAKTIHRMIGFNNFNKKTSELIKINADFVVMDEASMVDAYIFHCFLSCMSESTKILLVGDYEQLPSVGPGLILRDLINSEVIPTTILNKIFRQARNSQIITNSHKAIKGIKTTDIDGITFNKNKKDFYFIKNKNKRKISNLILKSIDRLLKTGFKIEDIQVLSTMNKGDLGVIELNKKIQSQFNQGKKNRIQIGTNRCLKVNDRVMQTINNYNLGVFNGEVGTIVSIKNGKNKIEVIVNFENKIINYKTSDICELTLAYAITVHKSQGSEFPVVIMPFHSSLNILLNRNIIYTAWTRAKERVVCIGDIEELNKGIDKIDNIVRNSKIKEKIINKTKVTNCDTVLPI